MKSVRWVLIARFTAPPLSSTLLRFGQRVLGSRRRCGRAAAALPGERRPRARAAAARSCRRTGRRCRTIGRLRPDRRRRPPRRGRSGRCRRSSRPRRRSRPRSGTAPGRPGARSPTGGSWITSLPVRDDVVAEAPRELVEPVDERLRRADRARVSSAPPASGPSAAPRARRLNERGRLREPRQRRRRSSASSCLMPGQDRLRERAASARTTRRAPCRRDRSCAAAPAAARSSALSSCWRDASAAIVGLNVCTKLGSCAPLAASPLNTSCVADDRIRQVVRLDPEQRLVDDRRGLGTRRPSTCSDWFERLAAGQPANARILSRVLRGASARC